MPSRGHYLSTGNRICSVINDTDLQLSQTSQNVSHKYVAYDGNSWKVCLGMHSLKQATLKFKLMAARRQNYDPVLIYNNAVSRNDPLTGLLSERGFYDDAFKEIERHKRYNNPVSFAVFQIDCEKLTESYIVFVNVPA